MKMSCPYCKGDQLINGNIQYSGSGFLKSHAKIPIKSETRIKHARKHTRMQHKNTYGPSTSLCGHVTIHQLPRLKVWVDSVYPVPSLCVWNRS